ncbi:hypothetical protein ACHAWT_010078 [Skeletonema menzelii]
MRIRRHYTATALGVCLVAVISITGSGVVSAAQSSSNGRGIFRRLPWNLSSSPSSAGSTSSSSVHNNNKNHELTTRGGAAERISTRRPPIKGAASSATAVKKGSVKKMKKMVKKRVVPNNASKGPPAQLRSGPNRDTMPSIFRIPSEEKYDRYAAALAITEGLRKIRDADVARAEKIYKQTPRSARNNSPKPTTTTDSNSTAAASAVAEPLSPKETLELSKQQAESAFLIQCTKAVKSLGMTVAQFNQIGREVLSDPALKERVSEQAYLYRIHASAMSLDKVPLLNNGDNTNENEDVLKNHKRHQVQMFARSIQEIEDLRTDQLNQLQSQLRMTQFPPNFDLSDPNVQPLLRDEVRAVCERFPAKAEEIVKRYGLESEEFNKMLEETKGNPIFRWRVMKTVRGVEEERRKKKERKTKQ